MTEVARNGHVDPVAMQRDRYAEGWEAGFTDAVRQLATMAEMNPRVDLRPLLRRALCGDYDLLRRR